MSDEPFRPWCSEDERKKLLRFDSRYLQSAMYKHAPFDLALSYTRTVMGFLLLQPEPRDILILGLGGGSLSKYCYRHLPYARVTTVEIDAGVIALRDEFEIPPDDCRFRIAHDDGAAFVAACDEQGFDVIVLDAYGRDGLPESLSSQDFYDRCAQALREGGVVVANYLENDRRHSLYCGRLSRAFQDRLVRVPADRASNRIVFGLKGVAFPTPAQLQQRAGQFSVMHPLNYRPLAAQIQRELTGSFRWDAGSRR